MVDIFHDSRKNLPRSDGRIVRVPFEKSDIGARTSHINGNIKKNENTIRHIKGS